MDTLAYRYLLAKACWGVLAFLSGGLFGIAAHVPVYSYSRTLPDKGRVWTVILRHLDGDTVQLGSIVDEGTVRLRDIDTPELEPRLNLTDEQKRDPVIVAQRKEEIAREKIAAKKSSARLRELLPINSVWRTEINGHDGFDRPLVRFFKEDGKTINRQMIDEGMAKEYRP